MLQEALTDIRSVTRAMLLRVKDTLDVDMEEVKIEGDIKVGLIR
jgi:hypothetical protein